MNPVKSRICKIPGLGDEAPRVGYIKLTAFNQNASGILLLEILEILAKKLFFLSVKLLPAINQMHKKFYMQISLNFH